MAITKPNGERIENAPTDCEITGGKAVIPDNTKLLCQIVGVRLDVDEKGFNSVFRADRLQVYLKIIEDGEFKGSEQIHNLKLWAGEGVTDKQQSKAYDMFGAYDAIAGGKIAKSPKDWEELLEDGTILDYLTGVEVLVTFALMERTNEATGEPLRPINWVRAIAKPEEKPSAKPRQATQPPARTNPPARTTRAATPPPPQADDDFDDSIPF